MTYRSIAVCIIHSKNIVNDHFKQRFFRKVDSISYLGVTGVKLSDLRRKERQLRVRNRAEKDIFSELSYIYYYHANQIPINIYVDPNNHIDAPILNYDSTKSITIFAAKSSEIPLENHDLANKFLKTIVELIPLFEPEFAWGDSWKNIMKEKGKDPRSSIWGFNYWNDLLSQELGLNLDKEIDNEKWQKGRISQQGTYIRAIPNAFNLGKRPKNNLRKEIVMD